LDVLQEDVCGGACDFLYLHQPHVGSDLVLHTVLLEDVDGLEECELLYPGGQGQSAIN